MQSSDSLARDKQGDRDDVLHGVGDEKPVVIILTCPFEFPLECFSEARAPIMR